MTDVLSRQDIVSLASKVDGERVSIFLPTHRVSQHRGEDHLRCKNLIANAEKQLKDLGLRPPDIQKITSPAHALLDDTTFWIRQADGLAMFLSADESHYYRVPWNLEELAVVNQRFHVKPLLPFLSDNGRFYILAISQNHIRFLQGSRFGVAELDIEQLPKNLADALRLDDPEKEVSFHTRAPERGGRRAAMFHGHGSGKDDMNHYILQYFQDVDRGLSQLLNTENAPLVLASVKEHFSVYRNANSYAHLVNDGIEGNPDHWDDNTLHDKAWPIVQPIFHAKEQQIRASFQQLDGTGRTSVNLDEALVAASQGRVASLFVAVDRHVWGTFDKSTGEVSIHDSQQPGDEDLLDRVAAEAMMTDATIYAVPKEEVPEEKDLAAIYRY